MYACVQQGLRSDCIDQSQQDALCIAKDPAIFVAVTLFIVYFEDCDTTTLIPLSVHIVYLSRM